METKRVALVTGAMGYLGTALCRGLARAGFRVAATYMPDYNTTAAWLAAQRDAGFVFTAFPVDVADFASCERMVQRVTHDMGRIDVLVNQAQTRRDRFLLDMARQDWDAVMRVNLDGIFNMSKQVLEGMQERGWGRIINIASVEAQQGAVGQSNDIAAKSAMHGVTKALALEVAKYGVTVNTVSPGYLRTPRAMDVPPSVLTDTILPKIPVGRLGEPSEVAAMVSYLCSDDAGFMTGANLAINGGQYMN